MCVVFVNFNLYLFAFFAFFVKIDLINQEVEGEPFHQRFGLTRFWLSANSWQPEAAHPEHIWQIGVSEDGFILDLLLYQSDTHDASHSREEQKQVSCCFVNRGEGGGVSSVSRCYSDTKRKEQVSCSDVINVRLTCWSTSNIAPHEEVVYPDVCICNGCRPHPRIISRWDCRWPVTYFFRIQVFLKLTEH